MNLTLAERLSEPVWGQGFPAAAIPRRFPCRQRARRGRQPSSPGAYEHAAGAHIASGVLFGRSDPLPEAIHAVFRLDINEYNAMRSLQLVLEHWEPAHDAVTRLGAQR
jgi:single-stranded-DNA-specific exonuclease